MGELSFEKLLIIAVVIMVLFGAKKIPELMRGLGKGVREFNDGKNGILRDMEGKANNASPDATTTTKQSSTITDVEHETVK
ncbi:Sec-independent protein translocase subunit TatA/TatB [Arachidicoccus soli]|uniref:Sec-independent protein translocase protein TatA n=1 Tax=Arachidicoccus soli TaxID=2341117 RepID=A0A386HLP1_9BACT|nr:twin-arginine translocase TatA/TatE family subunit [Arachidicoccus soli]AYD46536.1 twin-arginine translocase TatA/TatE family subunit [Arachidicoccus soli]